MMSLATLSGGTEETNRLEKKKKEEDEEGLEGNEKHTDTSVLDNTVRNRNR